MTRPLETYPEKFLVEKYGVSVGFAPPWVASKHVLFLPSLLL